jgi:nitrilase
MDTREPTWTTANIQGSRALRHIDKEGPVGRRLPHGASEEATFRQSPSPERDRLFPPDEWINDGSPWVVQPGGRGVVAAALREMGILYAL